MRPELGTTQIVPTRVGVKRLHVHSGVGHLATSCGGRGPTATALICWSATGPDLGSLRGALPSAPASRAAVPATSPAPTASRSGVAHETGLGRAALAVLPGFTLSGDTLASRRRSPWSSTAEAAQHLAGRRRPAASPAEPRPAVCGGPAGRDACPADPSNWSAERVGYRASHSRSCSARPPPGAQDGRGRGCDAGVRGPRVEVRVRLIRSGAISFALLTMSRCGSMAATQNRAVSL